MRMRNRNDGHAVAAVGRGGAGALLLLAVSATVAAAQSTPATATAELRDAAGATVGTATLRSAASGISVQGTFRGLPAGVHGIHLHALGQCDAPDFMTAGGHFNPAGRAHGLRNPGGAHVGDLPNLSVATNGTATYSGTSRGGTLAGGAEGLLDADGAALVIHAMADDEMTDPTGNSGGRIACGVVVAGARAAPVQAPAALPRTGDFGVVGPLAALVGVGATALGAALRRRGR